MAFFASVLAAAPAAATAPVAMSALAALGVLMATWGLIALQRPGLVAQRLGMANVSARTLEEMELQLSFRRRVLAPLFTSETLICMPAFGVPVIAGVMMLFGYLAIRRIVSIEV